MKKPKTKTRTKRRRHEPRRKADVGAAPGQMVVHPDAVSSTLHVFAFGADRIVEAPAATLEQIDALRADHPVVWVDIVGLADLDLLHAIGERFRLHPLALEDVTQLGQRPKVELYGTQLFAVLRQASLTEDGVDKEQVSLAIGPGFVVTFQERAGDPFEPVRARLRQGRPRIRGSGADYLGYALVDAVVDAYYPAFEAIGARLDDLEVAVYEGDETVVATLAVLRHQLLEMRRVLWPTRDALAALIRHEAAVFAPETVPFLRDCHDNSLRQVDLTESMREAASTLMDVYLALAGQRLNQVMKVLTVIATVFMPLGFIAGVFGMNFDRASPFNMPELGWRYGYAYALGLMVAVALVLLVFFRRKRWL